MELMHYTRYMARLCQESVPYYCPAISRFKVNPRVTKMSRSGKSKTERIKLFRFDSQVDSDKGYYYSGRFELDEITVKEVCKVTMHYSPLDFKFLSKYFKKQMHMTRDCY